MKKFSILLASTLLGGLVFAQTSKVRPTGNHTIAKFSKTSIVNSSEKQVSGPVTYQQHQQNTAGKTNVINTVQLGSSGNAYTNVTTEVNLIGTVPGQNWVSFFHRHNQQDFGGHSGQFRVDVSLDAGQTWETDNDGNDAFNPNSAPYGRIPQATLYNPPGNTDVCNAKLVWVSTGHKTPSPAQTGPNAAWGHFVNGTVSSIQSSCNNAYVSTFNSQEMGTVLYNTGLCQGANGEFWTAGVKFTRDDQLVQDKIYVWKGNMDMNQGVGWNIFDSLSFGALQDSEGGYQISTPQVAFSPNGQYGWIIVGGMRAGTAPYKRDMYFWKSSDFGATWQSGSMNLFNNQQIRDSLITYFVDSMSTIVDSTTALPFPIDYDLTVDWQGNPHIVATFFNMYRGATLYLDSLGYLSTGARSNIWDITTQDFGSSWNFRYITELNTFRGSSGGINYTAGCQAATNATGDAIFYAWVDDTSANAPDAMLPDLWTFHYDLADNNANLSNLKDWTTGDATWDGKIILPTVGPMLIDKGMGITGPKHQAAIAFTKILTSDTSPVENWFIQDVEVEFSTVTGRSETNANILSMSVYPNPSQGNFKVSLDLKGTNNVNLKVYDVLGKVVYQHSANAVSSYNQDVNISNLPAGVYVVKVTTNSGTVERKIVKE